MRYYFLGCALPSLSFNKPPEISSEELTSYFKLNLSHSDIKKNKTLRSYIDLYNLKAYWEGRPIDHRGNLNEKEIEEALLTKDVLAPYVFNFLTDNETIEDKLLNFPKLLQHFYKNQIDENEGFLKSYFSFEREVNLVLLALRAKSYNKDIAYELRFEDSKDFLVSYILSQKDMVTFEPMLEHKFLKKLFEEYKNLPDKLYKAILEYKFNHLQKLYEKTYFSIDQLLAYTAMLIISEEVYYVNKQEGKEIVDELLRG
jgi:hypothetical protein